MNESDGERQRTARLREWMLNLFCWDGMLPLAVILVPRVISSVFAQQHGVMEVTFVVVPVIAFVVRYLNGIGRFHSRSMYWWQLILFFVAIFILFGLDAALVMLCLVQQGPVAEFWIIWLSIYSAYLVIMALAMLPARCPRVATSNAIANPRELQTGFVILREAADE